MITLKTPSSREIVGSYPNSFSAFSIFGTLINISLLFLFDSSKGMNVYKHLYYASFTRAVVKDGYWDVESVLKATAELLKKTKYHGYFVENFAKANGIYKFANEVDFGADDVLEVHIGS